MRRGDYIRLSAFMLPNDRDVPDLSDLASKSIELWIMEGWLSLHIQFPGRIILVARVREGEPVLGYFTSARILRIQGHHVLTADTLYAVKRIKPSRRGDTFAEFA